MRERLSSNYATISMIKRLLLDANDFAAVSEHTAAAEAAHRKSFSEFCTIKVEKVFLFMDAVVERVGDDACWLQ